MFSSCIHATPTQRTPQPLRPPTDNSVKVCFLRGEPEHFDKFCPKGHQSSDCVVDNDDNDVNGEVDENDVTMYAQC